jgi:hypothetical protein
MEAIMTRVFLFGIAAALAAAMSPQGSLTAEAEQTVKVQKGSVQKSTGR